MIQNLIITNHGGLALFARSLMCHFGFMCIDLTDDGKNGDEDLLKSALFSAKVFYDQTQLKTFHEFEMERTKVVSYLSENIIAMYTLTPESERVDYENRLKLTAELFEQNFNVEINEFNGRITDFNRFQEIIVENGLLEEGERFRANCINCLFEKACPFRIFTGPMELSLKERISAIKQLHWYQKFFLILKGVFFTKMFMTPKIVQND
jgi:hypothetical protein